MDNLLAPIGAILLGLVGLAVYVLAVCLREATKRMADMNERLMVLLGTRDGGEAVGRALVASRRPLQRPTSSKPAKEEKKKKPDMTVTYGSL